MRRLPGLALIVASLATVATAAQQAPRFRSRVELIEVDAVVVDDKGQVVTGLSRDDFEIFEDGHAIPIATFVPVASADAPEQQESRFILLVLDDLATEITLTTKIQNVARMFAERMGPRDVVAVVPLNGGKGSTSTNRAQVLAAIDRFKPTFRRSSPTGWGLRTIADLADQMAHVKHRRKTIVCIGAAGLFSPTEPVTNGSPTYGPEWFDAVRAAARANASLYVLDPIGLAAIGDIRSRRPGLGLVAGDAYNDGGRTFAEITGGVAFVNSNLFERNVGQIWSEAGNYYLLGYEPPASKAKSHDIEVRVKRPGLQVRARRSRS